MAPLFEWFWPKKAFGKLNAPFSALDNFFPLDKYQKILNPVFDVIIVRKERF